MTIYVSRARNDAVRFDRGRAGKGQDHPEICSYVDLMKHADDTIERAIRHAARVARWRVPFAET